MVLSKCGAEKKNAPGQAGGVFEAKLGRCYRPLPRCPPCTGEVEVPAPVLRFSNR